MRQPRFGATFETVFTSSLVLLRWYGSLSANSINWRWSLKFCHGLFPGCGSVTLRVR